MKLPHYVISKPRIFGSLPFIGNRTASSIGSYIFVPYKIYKDLTSRNPKPQHIALLIHEEAHRKRQKEIGFIKFGLHYIFNPAFRFHEELLAVKEAMKYLKENNIPFDFDGRAKFLSSYIYLWPVSKRYALQALKKAWNEI